jgi:glutamate:GABA antiporter
VVFSLSKLASDSAVQGHGALKEGNKRMATYNIPIKEKTVKPLASEGYVVQTMPPLLGSVDMTATYLVAIFFIVNAATAASGGPAAFTFLIVGAVTFFIPCAIATAQLGHMHPNEGSLYNWTHKALGGYWSFFIGFCAWFPGVLVIVAGAVIVVSFIQGLNSNWLTQPWEQGIAIMALIAFSGVIAVQRLRTVQYVVNVMVVLIGIAVVLIGLSGLVWLAKGHPSATNFHVLSDWNIKWGGTGNINLFGLITLAYLGTEVPLNMGGEISGLRVVSRHMLWGTVLVLVGYFVATFSLLVVQGSAVGSIGGYSLVTNVDMVLGKFAGNITALCIIGFFVIVPVVYNYTFARLLLVGAIDQRLPMKVGRLNKHRVPANAIFFQTFLAMVFTFVVFNVAPYVANLGKPSDLANEVYNVSQAGATLVWAISASFFFVNLAIFFFRDRAGFHRQRIFPSPILLACIIIGPISCLVAIVDTLFFSWIPQIDNNHWWYIIGGLTLICLIVAAIGSMIASSEAAWQGMGE